MMNVYVTHEQRFTLGDDGVVYTDNDHTSGYAFFRRYLSAFETVTVVGRLASSAGSGSLWPVTGPGVGFAPVPYYLGPWECLQKSGAIRKAIRSLTRIQQAPCAYIARCPGTIGSILVGNLARAGFPYAMEILGDPYEVFRPGAVTHPLRPIFRLLFTRTLRRECFAARAVSYVTREALQRRYPPGKHSFSTHYSSIELEASAIVRSPRPRQGEKGRCKLVFVGSLAQMYKGVDVLVEAVGLCRQAGADVALDVIGDGKYREGLERMAWTSGIRERVRFWGALPSGERVRERLDEADLFVLPSRSEGLPRALIEAMARGLPCIGSAVGGIPELLAAEDLVPPGNAKELAKKLVQTVSDPGRLEVMSARNLQTARQYESSILQKRRNVFYSQVRAMTSQHWARNHG